MVPSGQITELRVWKMIGEAIDKYDLGNTERHKENRAALQDNAKKLDRLIWAAAVIFATSAGALALEIIRLSLK